MCPVSAENCKGYSAFCRLHLQVTQPAIASRMDIHATFDLCAEDIFTRNEHNKIQKASETGKFQHMGEVPLVAAFYFVCLKHLQVVFLSLVT